MQLTRRTTWSDTPTSSSRSTSAAGRSATARFGTGSRPDLAAHGTLRACAHASYEGFLGVSHSSAPALDVPRIRHRTCGVESATKKNPRDLRLGHLPSECRTRSVAKFGERLPQVSVELDGEHMAIVHGLKIAHRRPARPILGRGSRGIRLSVGSEYIRMPLTRIVEVARGPA
jgi:hypothetical protein